ncbi:MAG TPA: hypothetical protein VGD65_11555 [Chryseosolibacter sp.]
MNTLKKLSGAAALLVAAFACENQDATQGLTPLDDSPIFMELQRPHGSARTADEGNFAVFSAEYLTAAESGQIGRTIYFSNVGNKQLSADFVPGYSIDGTDNITYYVDENRPSADLPVANTTAALVRAMNTWDGVTCSNLGLTQVPSNAAINTGYVSALLGFGGSFGYTADLVHAGWLPKGFFDFLAPNGSSFILGVTFTITFTDAEGNPTDVDNNGKADVAWREIYYNDRFTWRIGNHYDVETIALHEAGHGLSQGHFGTAFESTSNEKLHFSPRAVMNAAYSGIQTQIGATDNAGHCSNWAAWPGN